MDKIFNVKCEVNDKGWHSGYYHFTKVEDAIKLMRNYVARQIWFARSNGMKVTLIVLADTVMGDVSRNPLQSQTIFVRIGKYTFEYRVWMEDLLDKELPKEKCFNY